MDPSEPGADECADAAIRHTQSALREHRVRIATALEGLSRIRGDLASRFPGHDALRRLDAYALDLRRRARRRGTLGGERAR